MRHAWLMATVLAAPAFAQPASDKLDDTQRLGQRLFNQSCRVCHAKPQLTSVQYGPVVSRDSLGGDARVMREVISNGTPRMPGFKIHFQPAEIDVGALDPAAQLRRPGIRLGERGEEPAAPILHLALLRARSRSRATTISPA